MEITHNVVIGIDNIDLNKELAASEISEDNH
jgi:hypothetical protein